MKFETAIQIWSRLNIARCPVAQAPEDWGGSDPLPSVVAEFYRCLGPNELYCFDRTHLVHYFPSLQNLHQLQQAFVATGWNPDWMVLAHEDSNAFVVDLETNAIKHVKSGTQGPDEFPAFTTIPEFMAGIGLMIEFLDTPLDDGLLCDVFDEDDGFHMDCRTGLAATLSTIVSQSSAEQLIARMFDQPTTAR